MRAYVAFYLRARTRLDLDVGSGIVFLDISRAFVKRTQAQKKRILAYEPTHREILATLPLRCTCLPDSNSYFSALEDALTDFIGWSTFIT